MATKKTEEINDGSVVVKMSSIGIKPKAGDIDTAENIAKEEIVKYYNDVLSAYDKTTMAHLDVTGTIDMGTYRSVNPLDMSTKVTRFDTTVKQVKSFTRNLHEDMVNDFRNGKP